MQTVFAKGSAKGENEHQILSRQVFVTCLQFLFPFDYHYKSSLKIICIFFASLQSVIFPPRNTEGCFVPCDLSYLLELIIITLVQVFLEDWVVCINKRHTSVWLNNINIYINQVTLIYNNILPMFCDEWTNHIAAFMWLQQGVCLPGYRQESRWGLNSLCIGCKEAAITRKVQLSTVRQALPSQREGMFF